MNFTKTILNSTVSRKSIQDVGRTGTSQPASTGNLKSKVPKIRPLLTQPFQMSQLMEFGLDPRDWLLKDIRSTGSFNRKLQHRDEEDIHLRIELGPNGEIKDVEVFILSLE